MYWGPCKFYANGACPYQMLHLAASDIGYAPFVLFMGYSALMG